MSNQMLQIGVFLALFSLIFTMTLDPVFAAESDYEWTENPDGTVTITSYTGNGREVHIPSTLDGKPVHKINDFAFSEKGLTRISIPESVKAVGEGAFQGNKLKHVTISPKVKEWGTSVFAENDLTSIEILEGVIALSDKMFLDNQLTEVVFPESMEKNRSTCICFKQTYRGHASFTYKRVGHASIFRQ